MSDVVGTVADSHKRLTGGGDGRLVGAREFLGGSYLIGN